MDVLINHPAFGSIWLEQVNIVDGTVIGDYWDTSDVGSAYMPADYLGELVTLNFPVSCIRKVCTKTTGYDLMKELKKT